MLGMLFREDRRLQNGPKMVGAVPQQTPQQYTEPQTIRYTANGYFKKNGIATMIFTAAICRMVTATVRENGPVRRINTPTTAIGI